MLTLRAPSAEDAPTLGRICFEAFGAISDAHGFPRDFPSAEAATGLMSSMIASPAFFGVAAEEDGRLIGSNFLDERSAIFGVGPITVDPSIQNKGVGPVMQAMGSRTSNPRSA